MNELRKLPIGIESFEEIRREDFYYVDKTQLIEHLLNRWGRVGESESFYQTTAFWQVLKHEYVKEFF